MSRKLLTRNEKFRRKCLAFLQSDRFLHYFGKTFVKGFKSIPDFTEVLSVLRMISGINTTAF